MSMSLWFNLLCGDVDAQLGFYGRLLGWPEAVHSRSPIYRALEQGGVQFGFNARAAYALLAIADRQPAEGAGAPPVTAYATFMLDAPGDVDRSTADCEALGGRIVKAPYATYYGQWQSVLTDPERNVFRLASLALPSGVRPPPRPT